MPENDDELPKTLNEDLEQRLDHFDASWTNGGTPSIEAYLPMGLRTASPPSRPHLRRYVAELLSVDLEHRFRRSSEDEGAPRIEDYFDTVGWLPGDDAVLSELIQVEALLRHQTGERVATDEYVRRFPSMESAVRRSLETAQTEFDRERSCSEVPAVSEVTECFNVADEETLHQAEEPVDATTITTPMLQTLGDYELQHEIARGGMGLVYKAIQRSLKRPVALKVILAGAFADADDIRRFHSEAEAAAKLDHPNIVPIFEVGEEQGHPYFSMAYIDGPSLSAVVAHQPLEAERAARLLRDVAGAIEYAHQRGVIHRDLKPSNILLEGETTPRVTDFGLARQTNVESGFTERGQVLGAPPYMPPEQALGHIDEVDARSDVYSLGATLYHLVTGRPPFTAASVLQTLAQVVQDDPLPPRRLNHHIPRDLENICLKCLNKSPDDRYPSAEALREDLDRFLRGRPTLARPLSGWERMYRFCRRQPRVAALLGVVLASVLLVLVATSTAWVMTREALRTTRLSERQARHSEQKAVDAQRRAESSEADAIKQKQIAQRHLRVAESNTYLLTLQRARRLWNEGQVDSFRSQLVNLPAALSLWDELHGWEYDYTWGLRRQEVRKVSNAHRGRINTLTWSSDGQRMASAGQDETIKIWDRQNLQQLETCTAHTGWILSIGFVGDGRRLLSLAQDGTARVWDEQTSWLDEVVASELRGLKVAAIAADGHRWSWSDGQRIEVRELDAAEPLLQEESPVAEISALAFDRTGDKIAVADATSGLITVRAIDREQSPVTLEFSGGRCFAMDFSRDGMRLAAGGSNGWLHVWDLSTGQLVGRWSENQGSIYDIRFSSDDDQLLTCSDDQTVRLWSIAREQSQEVFRGHTEPVFTVHLQPDGDQLLSAGDDGTLRIWQPRRGQMPLEGVSHIETILPTDNESGLRYVAGDRLREVHFDAPARMTEIEIPGPPIRHVVSVTAPPGSFVAVQSVELHHFGDDGTLMQTYEVPDTGISTVCCSAAGDLLAVAESTPHVRVFDVASGRQLWEQPFDARVVKLTFIPGTQRLIAVDLYGMAHLFDLSSDEPLLSAALSDGMLSLCVSPSEPILAVGERDGTIRLHGTGDLIELIALHGHQQGVNDVAFSPDGRRIASAGTDGAVRIWSPDHPTPLLTLDGHQQPVMRVFWRDQGRTVVSIDRDGIALRWQSHDSADH